MALTTSRIPTQAVNPRAPHAQGFTLIELLLAVVVTLLIMSAVVFETNSLRKGARLEEGARQLESLFRFTKAHAAQSGLRLRLVIRPNDTPPPQPNATGARPLEVLVESHPLHAPGTFTPLPAAAHYLNAIDQLVRIVRAERFDLPPQSQLNPNAPRSAAPAFPSADNEDLAQPITVDFYADGSVEPVQILLASQDDDDPRRLALTWKELSDTVTQQLFPDAAAATAMGPDDVDAAEETSASVAPAEEVVP